MISILVETWRVVWSIVIPGMLFLGLLWVWFVPADMRQHCTALLQLVHKVYAVGMARADFVEVRREHRAVARRKQEVIRRQIEADLKTAYSEAR